MKTYSHGQTYPAMEFEIVPIPPPAAHDRVSVDGVQVKCMPAYSAYPLGRKAQILRRENAFRDTVKDLL